MGSLYIHVPAKEKIQSHVLGVINREFYHVEKNKDQGKM